MSLYRVGKIWYYAIPSNKGRIRCSTGTADKKAAQELHDKVKAEFWRQDRLGEPPKVTWDEAVDKWLDHKPRGLPDRYTLGAMDIAPSSLMPLSSSIVEGALSSCTASTFNRYLALVISIHSLSGLQPPPVKRRPVSTGRTRWLSQEEWQRLRAALAHESSLLLDLADFSIATGVRENNALELRWEQVDLKRRVAWFYADQMKGRVAHGIPLNNDAITVLRKRVGEDKVYVFAHPDSGKPLYKASNRAWYNALRRAKLTDVVWHTLRHSWASWAVMSGVRLEELMQLGGWKTYAMVRRYAHLSTEHLAAVAAKIRPVSVAVRRSKKAASVTN